MRETCRKNDAAYAREQRRKHNARVLRHVQKLLLTHKSLATFKTALLKYLESL